MAELINAKCPNCGAILELPSKLDRAFCMHCGGKVIVAKDVQAGKTAIACPECEGLGYLKCNKDNFKWITHRVPKGLIYIHSCEGSKKCLSIVVNNWVGMGFQLCDSGKCSYCKGNGKTFFGRCGWCKGTGKCPICEGTGKCKFCNGEGKVKCEACNSTGFKVYEGD